MDARADGRLSRRLSPTVCACLAAGANQGSRSGYYRRLAT
jgi:hypothetical protein